jgi:hypothetical protein
MPTLFPDHMIYDSSFGSSVQNATAVKIFSSISVIGAVPPVGRTTDRSNICVGCSGDLACRADP